MDMRRAKIVCTVGPASRSEDTVGQLLHAGGDVIRLNFSHGTHADHAKAIRTVREVSGRQNRPVAILQDLQGPRIRIGVLRAGPVRLVEGETVTLTTHREPEVPRMVPVTYGGLPGDVSPGDRIMVDDGRIELRVLDAAGSEVRCEVIAPGLLESNKGMNLPGVRVSAPSLTDKDREDLAFGTAHGVDYVALSFVRDPSDIREVRSLLERSGADVPVIAKLERAEAVDNLDAILDAADGVMVARGDLGVELPLEEVPVIQKRIIAAANRCGVLVITATQMLESMTTSHRPTRAEASDVANAVLDGTDAVMLSGETAVGRHPVAAVRTMSRIVEAAEASIRTAPQVRGREEPVKPLSFPDAIGHAASAASEDVRAKAIVAFTQSGFTARLISKYRPRTPIIALTPHEGIRRRLSLVWGTQPRLMDLVEETDRMMEEVEARLLADGTVRAGDSVVILSGAPITARGSTNLLKLHRVGEVA